MAGGSNAGRGTLGALKNFENCKYILQSNSSLVSSINSIQSGRGGCKNHQMDSDIFGFGGGIIHLLARGALNVAGEIHANGGSMSEKDYTMIAGGAGGTLVLVGRSVNLAKTGLVSVRGGLSSDEVIFS